MLKQIIGCLLLVIMLAYAAQAEIFPSHEIPTDRF